MMKEKRIKEPSSKPFKIYFFLLICLLIYSIAPSKLIFLYGTLHVNKTSSVDSHIDLPIIQKEKIKHDKSHNLKSFRDTLKSIPTFFNSKPNITTDYISQLARFIIMEPTIQSNSSCQKPKLTTIGQKSYAYSNISLSCSDYPKIFTGNRKNPAKISMMILFSFEADVLEIYLNEIYDYIDKFFIVESEITHNLGVSIPLLWPELSKQERFQKFSDKIVHFVVTKEMINEIHYEREDVDEDIKMWHNERAKEEIRWKFFLEWNKNNSNYFQDEDIIGFGDCDEIPAFYNLILLKKCRNKGNIDIGIWFTFGQVNMYYRSEYPVKDNPNTLGDPTFWTIKTAKDFYFNENKTPSRMRGKSDYSLLGGLHYTQYRYIPYLMLKEATMTEADDFLPVANIIKKGILNEKSMKDISYDVFYAYEQERRDRHKLFSLSPDQLGIPPFIVPWFLNCNRERYSSFFKTFPFDERIAP